MDNFVSNLTTYLILTHLTLDIYLCLDHEVVKHFPFGPCRLFIYPHCRSRIHALARSPATPSHLYKIICCSVLVILSFSFDTTEWAMKFGVAMRGCVLVTQIQISGQAVALIPYLCVLRASTSEEAGGVACTVTSCARNCESNKSVHSRFVPGGAFRVSISWANNRRKSRHINAWQNAFPHGERRGVRGRKPIL
jgi:hypothetical protein